MSEWEVTPHLGRNSSLWLPKQHTQMCSRGNCLEWEVRLPTTPVVKASLPWGVQQGLSRSCPPTGWVVRRKLAYISLPPSSEGAAGEQQGAAGESVVEE